MAAKDSPHYLLLVEHNLDVLGLLADAAKACQPPKDVSDWKCTLLFYMACTYVKALGRARRKDIQDHYQLRQWLNTTQDLWSLARPYRKLEERSRDARYEGRCYSRGELSRCLTWFESVRDGIVALLKAEGVDPVPTVDPAPWLG